MTQGELYMPKVSLVNCPEAELQIDVWQYYLAQAYINVFATTDASNRIRFDIGRGIGINQNSFSKSPVDCVHLLICSE